MSGEKGRAEAERRYGTNGLRPFDVQQDNADDNGNGRVRRGRSEAQRRYGNRVQRDPADEQAALDEADARDRAVIAHGAMRLAARTQ